MASENDKAVTVLIDTALLKQGDERARALDLNRSQYIRRLLRKDLEQLVNQPATPPQPQEVAA